MHFFPLGMDSDPNTEKSENNCLNDVAACFRIKLNEIIQQHFIKCMLLLETNYCIWRENRSVFPSLEYYNVHTGFYEIY